MRFVGEVKHAHPRYETVAGEWNLLCDASDVLSMDGYNFFYTFLYWQRLNSFYSLFFLI